VKTQLSAVNGRECVASFFAHVYAFATGNIGDDRVTDDEWQTTSRGYKQIPQRSVRRGSVSDGQIFVPQLFAWADRKLMTVCLNVGQLLKGSVLPIGTSTLASG
jgi:hypothetical protein